MARVPSNLGPETEDHVAAGDTDEKAVENFSFDVSPNIRADEAEEPTASAPAPKSRHKNRRRASARQRGDSDRASVPLAAPADHQEIDRESPVRPEGEATPQSTTVRHKRKAKASRTLPDRPELIVKAKVKHLAKKKESLWRRRPAWVVSTGLHAAFVLILSLFGFVVAEPDEFLLWASTPEPEPLEVFQDVEIESPLDLEELETELPTELADPGMASLGEISSEAVFSELSETGPLSGNTINEWGSLFAEEGSGLTDLGTGEGNLLTTFFGTKSDARRVVFVIDNTGSMRSGGLETVIVEMMKTVEQLDERQEFYILFFSDQVYPMFFPHSERSFVHPTEKNKRKLREWLDTVEFCTGGVWQLTQALDAAYQLEPDVVYLLTDGRHWDMVQADYKVAAVKKLRSVANPLGIPIHTLGMGCETDFDRENLAQVAQANGGTFREVRVSPALADVAYRKNRPYHINGPGLVWGTQVRQRNYTTQEPQSRMQP